MHKHLNKKQIQSLKVTKLKTKPYNHCLYLTVNQLKRLPVENFKSNQQQFCSIGLLPQQLNLNCNLHVNTLTYINQSLLWYLTNYIYITKFWDKQTNTSDSKNYDLKQNFTLSHV